MRQKIEYLAVWLLLKTLGVLPHSVARLLGIAISRVVYMLHGRLRNVGRKNLQMALPELTARERKRILRNVFHGLGRQLADFAHFPKYHRHNIPLLAIYEGFENFDEARKRGKGVLFLTAHIGAWEVGSFAHSIYGNPMNIVVRNLDNGYVDALVRRYRTLHGNVTFDNRDFARGLLGAMRGGETVGILMDTNMTPPQGVFVDFFGIPACTASGLARVALKTDAAVVPAFTIWDSGIRKYKVSFQPALTLVRTGDPEADAVANTALFTKAIEKCVRSHPDQWLWVHRRWKTRPAGSPRIY
jgi:Kdo2-lipid IVA lauroyltransferase/acyltransferase